MPVPVYVDAAVRDYPITPLERVAFYHIASRAGYAGGWCTEKTQNMAEALLVNEKTLRPALNFLAKAGLIEVAAVKGRYRKFRPRQAKMFALPETLPLIRQVVYAVKKKKVKQLRLPQADINIVALDDFRNPIPPTEVPAKPVSLTGNFSLEVTDAMREWAEQECPLIIDLMAVTQRYLRYIERKISEGWNPASINAEAQWRTYVADANRRIQDQMRGGRNNVRSINNSSRAAGAEPASKVPRFNSGGR